MTIKEALVAAFIVPVLMLSCSDGDNPTAIDTTPSAFNLSETFLIFTATEGGTNPGDLTSGITNAGDGGMLVWTAATDTSWLSVTPNTGDTTTETDTITLSINIAGLTVGTYAGNVILSDSAASNDPQQIEVFLIVAGGIPTTDFLFTERQFKLGVGPIPQNFPGSDSTDFINMYDNVSQVAELMAVQGDWRDSAATSGQIPAGLNAFLFFKDTYNYDPVPAISFFQGEAIANLDMPDNPTNDWTNTDAITQYEQVALDIIQTYNVNYMGLGIEVNTYWQYDPADFNRFITAYQQMYANIKAIHPNVKIFVSFQLEKMKGIGTFSGPPFEAHWNLIDLFGDTLDVIAFTTYPGIEYASVANIPEDYYLEIRKYTNKPILFTEIGWATTMGGEQAQDDFTLKFFRISEGLNKEIVTWAFMHDLLATPPPGPLNGIGLRNNDGTAKLVWPRWQTLKTITYTGQ